MEYELVNVDGVRDHTFTAELIIPSSNGLEAVVGVYEAEGEGNLVPDLGISIYHVKPDQLTPTGESIFRSVGPAAPEYTPNLV
jgi:hypothetical protein